MPDIILEERMKKLSELTKQEHDLCEKLDLEISNREVELDVVRREREALAMPVRMAMASVEDTIRNTILENAAPFKCIYGQALYKKGYQRRSYDASALDKICATNETVKAFVWAFRKVSEVEPTVTIKVEV